jgi:hypothetical protein
MTEIRIIGLSLSCMVMLSACSLVEPDDLGSRLRCSESCYTPLRSRASPLVHPTKKGGEVPLVDDVPRGSLILGTFNISADFGFVLAALQHNARKVGADAVVIQKLTWWDINHWEESRQFVRTTRIPVSDAQKEEYQNNLKDYQSKRRQGKAAERPSEPTDSFKEETVSFPGRWSVNGGSSVEAVMLELPPARATLRQ